MIKPRVWPLTERGRESLRKWAEKLIPAFASEAEELAFWEAHQEDAGEYFEEEPTDDITREKERKKCQLR